MSAPAAPTAGAEREWWRRTLGIFRSPRAVFTALRRDSDEEAGARQEPVLALILLEGMAGILFTGASRRFLDEPLTDNSLAVVAVLVFLSGAIYGTAVYWLGGALLHLGLHGAGSQGSYRRSRHVLAFAAAPLVLSLLIVWPIRLAMFGRDAFREGGSDEGLGGWLFDGVSFALALWALGLLVYGISVVERWTVLRAAVSIGLVVLGLIVLTTLVVIPLSAS